MQNKLHLIGLLVALFSASGLFCQDGEWLHYSSGRSITAICEDSTFLWVGTEGGLVQINKITDQFTMHTSANSALPPGKVVDMALDEAGTLWITTLRGGLTSFDGTNWTWYNSENSDLPHNWLLSLLIHDGTIWIGSAHSGLISFDGSTWQTFSFADELYPDDHPFPPNEPPLRSLAVDSGGTIWIGTVLLVSFDGTTFELHDYPDEGSTRQIRSLAIDAAGTKWTATLDGQFGSFDGTTWTLFDSTNSEISDHHAQTIFIAENGTKWIGTDDCLIAYDNINWTLYDTENSDIIGNSVTSVLMGMGGVLWTGTDNGLSSYYTNSWTEHTTSPTGLPSSHIQSVAIDASGTKWFGTEDGVASFDGQNWTSFTTYNSDIPTTGVSSIAVGDDQRVWMGTGGKGLMEYDGTSWFLQSPTLLDSFQVGMASLAVDGSNAVWFGAVEYGYCNTGLGIVSYDGATWTVIEVDSLEGLDNGVVVTTDIAIDDQGNKWIATGDDDCWWGGAGLLRVDGGDNSIRVYNTANSGIPTMEVNSIAIDASGTKWLGTGAGLVAFDDSSWTVHTAANSELPDDVVDEIAVDSEDILWVGTINHIVKIDGSDWTVFGPEDIGLEVNPYEFMIRSIAPEQNGDVWIGTGGGLYVYHRSGTVAIGQDQRSKAHKPDFHLEQNYPNPFNPTTTLSYDLPTASDVTLTVYDITGRTITTLKDNHQPAGRYSVQWGGTDNSGNPVSTGLYFARLLAGNYSKTIKMVYLE